MPRPQDTSLLPTRRHWLCLALAGVLAACAHHARPPATAHTGGPVVVYGASWCAHTSEARAYLANHHVAMVFRDVERDPEAMDAMYRRLQETGQEYRGIPVIDVYGRVLVGYDADLLAEALDE